MQKTRIAYMHQKLCNIRKKEGPNQHFVHIYVCLHLSPHVITQEHALPGSLVSPRLDSLHAHSSVT